MGAQTILESEITARVLAQDKLNTKLHTRLVEELELVVKNFPSDTDIAASSEPLFDGMTAILLRAREARMRVFLDQLAEANAAFLEEKKPLAQFALVNRIRDLLRACIENSCAAKELLEKKKPVAA